MLPQLVIQQLRYLKVVVELVLEPLLQLQDSMYLVLQRVQMYLMLPVDLEICLVLQTN